MAHGLIGIRKLGIISSILLAVIIILCVNYLISASWKRKLRRLYRIWEKLPGLRTYDIFKEYEELFEDVMDGHIKKPVIPMRLVLRINWLIELSKSSVADIWRNG